MYPRRCEIFWNEGKTEFQFFAIFSLWDMVDFVLKVPSELDTQTTVSSTVWEPDSKSLTNNNGKKVGSEFNPKEFKRGVPVGSVRSS